MVKPIFVFSPPFNKVGLPLFFGARGESGKYFAIEIGVRLPGLRRDEVAIADGLLVYENAASLFGFEADVFVAGEAFTLYEVRSGQNLYSVTDGEYPFVLGIEFAD